MEAIQEIGANCVVQIRIVINRRFIRRIMKTESKDILRRMKMEKAAGPNETLIEAWKCLGDLRKSDLI
jgi:hypothetical protein